MLNRKDFLAILIGQILITLSLMTLAAKTQCFAGCDGILKLLEPSVATVAGAP